MSVRCNKQGRYTIDYYPSGAKGRRVQMMLPVGMTEEQARRMERDLRNKKNAPLISQDDRISFLVQQYHNHTEMHLSPRTCEDIKGCFVNHLVPFFGKMRVSELSTPLFSAYQKIRREKPAIRKRKQKAINRTINKELSYFSAFLKWAEAETGAVPSSPLRFRALPYKRPIPKILNDNEVDAILAHADDHYRGILMAIAHLGLRITSARMLKWKDISFADRSVHAHVKGGRELLLPMSDELYEWLKRKRDQNIYNSPWLFPSRTKPMRPIRDVRKALDKACTASGILKRVYPHLFRHSAAAHLLESGVDIRIVQELLGHTDIRMTQWYAQVALKTKQGAMIKAGHIKRPKGDSEK